MEIAIGENASHDSMDGKLKALDNIDLNLVSHRYVSGVLKDDHFVSACSRAPRF